MRIVAGEFKGRKLSAPKNDFIRPTTDKVREAIFSMLNMEIFGKIVLDMFAGTGALGLEALSRGAGFAYFFDSSFTAIKTLSENIAKLDASEISHIYGGDFRKSIAKLRGNFSDDKLQIDLVFLDPPYKKGYYEEALKGLIDYKLLAKNAMIVVESSIDTGGYDIIEPYETIKEKRYGGTLVRILGIK